MCVYIYIYRHTKYIILMEINSKLGKTQKRIRELKNISKELTNNRIWREK